MCTCTDAQTHAAHSPNTFSILTPNHSLGKYYLNCAPNRDFLTSEAARAKGLARTLPLPTLVLIAQAVSLLECACLYIAITESPIAYFHAGGCSRGTQRF